MIKSLKRKTSNQATGGSLSEGQMEPPASSDHAGNPYRCNEPDPEQMTLGGGGVGQGRGRRREGVLLLQEGAVG